MTTTETSEEPTRHGEGNEGRRHDRAGRRRRRRGRPRLPSELQRSQKVEVGLTQQQWSEWAETAASEYLTIQEWIRKLGDAAVVARRSESSFGREDTSTAEDGSTDSAEVDESTAIDPE
ncbi:MAG: hypothetical protein F4X94_06380 [Dehalococcoidia bacterium]|nr:hypothetical protein [Dehalococcoidia bacterium]